MKYNINFKASYLNIILVKVVVIGLIVGLIVSLIVFFWIEIDYIFAYLLSMFFVFMGVLFAFYKNRYELDKIMIQDEMIELVFLNKLFFKKNPVNCLKHEVYAHKDKENMDLFIDDDLIARIRSVSMSSEDWKIINDNFEL